MLLDVKQLVKLVMEIQLWRRIIFFFFCGLNCSWNWSTITHTKEKKTHREDTKKPFKSSVGCSIVVVKQLRLLDNYWNVPRYNEGREISCCFGRIPWPSLCAREWVGNQPSWQRESLCMEAYVYRYRCKNRTGLDAWRCDLIKTGDGSERTSNRCISESRGWAAVPRKVSLPKRELFQDSRKLCESTPKQHMTSAEAELTLPVVRTQLLFSPFKGNLTN